MYLVHILEEKVPDDSVCTLSVTLSSLPFLVRRMLENICIPVTINSQKIRALARWSGSRAMHMNLYIIAYCHCETEFRAGLLRRNKALHSQLLLTLMFPYYPLETANCDPILYASCFYSIYFITCLL